ncbi:MAG: SIS domain-containing protein [Acidobacteria bacterium]|nr:SIS domain-containing protein [Acidobacteriota bacterium]
MTHFLRDILRQPLELQRAVDHLSGPGNATLQQAATVVRGARHVFLTGIGSSWHAALAAAPLFYRGRCPVYLRDVAELLYGAEFPRDSVVVAISRSGRTTEIVSLLAKAREAAIPVIGVTNAAEGPLAAQAQIPLVIPAEPDHAISVNTYSTLATAVGALAAATVDQFSAGLADAIKSGIAQTERDIPGWQRQIENTAWLSPGATVYFLARGCSLGTAHEARLLWEEGAKSPATAMSASSFRHGPQEIFTKTTRFALWIDGHRMREADLAVARDLKKLGAPVLLVGQNLPADAADLVFQIPQMPPDWQFIVDAIPAQLAAERLARLAGVDSDSFRLCSYVVEDEFGLLPAEVSAPKDAK